jgi:hypothetical protein
MLRIGEKYQRPSSVIRAQIGPVRRFAELDAVPLGTLDPAECGYRSAFVSALVCKWISQIIREAVTPATFRGKETENL